MDFGLDTVAKVQGKCGHVVPDFTQFFESDFGIFLSPIKSSFVGLIGKFQFPDVFIKACSLPVDLNVEFRGMVLGNKIRNKLLDF